MTVKIAGVIPARLDSVRFPRKVLYPFAGLPMVEHVRRRAMLCPELSEVVVAACDDEVVEAIERLGGRVVTTSPEHRTGTDRVAEALDQLDCTHVIVIQGDEPLLLPDHLSAIAQSVRANPAVDAWNATTPIIDETELQNQTVVKCVISTTGRVLLCSRLSPCLSSFNTQITFIRKIQGLIAFKRTFLREFARLAPAPFECAESIEQSRIVEYDYVLRAVDLSMSYPSVNEPGDVALVHERIARDHDQQVLLERVLAFPGRD